MLFTDSLGAGGAQRQLCGLAVMLRQHNYDVVVLTYHPLDFYKSYLDENAISNVVLGNGCRALRRIQAIRNLRGYPNEHIISNHVKDAQC